jgi:hypothetical protein
VELSPAAHAKVIRTFPWPSCARLDTLRCCAHPTASAQCERGGTRTMWDNEVGQASQRSTRTRWDRQASDPWHQKYHGESVRKLRHTFFAVKLIR